MTACEYEYPNYPSLLGKSKSEVISYCATKTQRHLDNKIMIFVLDMRRYFYFSNNDEALKSSELMQHDIWWIDFREQRHSIRRNHLELRFQNGHVVSQRPGSTSDL